MRIIPAVAAVPLLIVLLTWLSMRALNTDAERFDRALGEIDHFAMTEASLHRDVLSERAGLLRNYDPLVQEANALDASIDRLQQIMADDVTSKSAIDRLAASVSNQENMIELFKSSNALLQNSLAYFAHFTSDLSTSGQTDSLVTVLAAAMLHLTLDTSAPSAREVRDRLDDLAQRTTLAGNAASVTALLAHGRLLHDLLPATDSVLKALFAVPHRYDREAVRTIILARQSASRATARQFRLFLYLASLVLVALLAYVGMQLQSRARALRRRAAFEHVLAGISMRFITAGPTDLDALMERALADMARCVGADRAYFLFAGSSPRTYQWCRQGVPLPPGWPDRAVSLLDHHYPSFDGVVHVPQITGLPSGDRRDALAAAGLQGWACAFGRGADGESVLLGFDAVTHPCRITRAGELGLLRMALDSMASALGRQALELERVRLETRLHQARRLETVGALASGIAHNFNNIIGAILGYTEMAREQNASHGILDDIRRAGERARELVDQILTFARRRDTQRSIVSMEALAAEAISLLRVSLPAEVELTVGDPPQAVFVSGAPAQLQQVLLNLCNNAAQAMGHAGRIELEIGGTEPRTAQSLSHGTLAPGRYARIAVSDSGKGIDDAVLERIFEPFFTTRVTGNGLGLATSLDIVREHGGAMNVQSVVGVGSTFEVWLPRIEAAAPMSVEEIAAPPLGHGETVLVVETPPDRLLRDEEILAALGYEPVGFTRAADALAACQASPERFDVAVVGHLLPATAALELTEALHHLAPGLAILLAAGPANQSGANALLVAGISDVVSWPIAAAEIAAALRDCLRRRSSRNEHGFQKVGDGHLE